LFNKKNITEQQPFKAHSRR